MQNICLVTTQSFKQGKSGRQNMETFAFASPIMFIKSYLRYQLEKNLLLNESLTTPWTNKLWK